MGCCVSKNDDPQNPVYPTHSPFSATEYDASRVKALLPALEEETVKEVLSETPLSFRKEEEEEKPPTVPTMEEEEKKIEMKVPVSVAEEMSEVSEICSLSVSESVSTTTITERIEDEGRTREDGEVQQRVSRSTARVHRKRPIPGDFAGRTERGGKSPARKSEPFPGEGNVDNVVKSVCGTEVGRRKSGSNNGARQSLERSGRRSKSPATRKDASSARPPGMGRSPSRRAGGSPGRKRAVAPENGKKLEESSMAEKQSANESLENPLVSLECFIFL